MSGSLVFAAISATSNRRLANLSQARAASLRSAATSRRAALVMASAWSKVGVVEKTGAVGVQIPNGKRRLVAFSDIASPLGVGATKADTILWIC